MPENYMQKVKQYQKQQQAMPHKKYDEQFPKADPNNVWKSHDYSKEHVLIAEEIDNLFWNTLVALGWKINTQFIADKSTAKSVQFMFVCPDCGKSLHCQQSHTITESRAKAMRDRRWLNQVIAKHKATTSGCQPPKYDENGEVIPEATPEA